MKLSDLGTLSTSNTSIQLADAVGAGTPSREEIMFKVRSLVVAVLAGALALAALPATTSYAAPTSGTYEDSAPELVYSGASWQTTSSSQDSGGTSAMTTRAGSVSLTFQGTGVAWMSRLTPSSGINDVYIDGEFRQAVDRFGPTTLYKQRVFEVSGLSEGIHTIEIRWTGGKNPAATGSNLLVDAIVVLDSTPPGPPTDLRGVPRGSGAELTWTAPGGEPVVYTVRRGNGDVLAAGLQATNFTAYGLQGGVDETFSVAAVDASGNESVVSAQVTVRLPPTARVGRYEETSEYITYTGAWTVGASAQDSGGGSAFATRTGSAYFTFEGEGIRWMSRLTPSAGINVVVLDGVEQTVDRYSSDTSYRQVVFERIDLEPGLHTVEIRWTGAANPLSSGSNVLVDAFEVLDVNPPDAPSGLRGVARDGGVALEWNAVADAAGYIPLRSNDEGSSWSDLVATPITDTSYFDGGLPGRTDLAYAVVAVDSSGNRSAPSSSVDITTEGSAGVGRYEQDDPLVAYTGTSWVKSSSSNDSGGSSAFTSRSGSVSFAFEGTAIQWISRTSASSGIARVLIDGVEVSTVDRYSARTMYSQVVFERRDLAPGSHVIQIEWTNGRNPAATANTLVIDAFVVLDTQPPDTPSGLIASPRGSGIALSWQAPEAQDLASYRIYRANQGEFAQIGEVAASNTEYVDATVNAGTPYRYSVSAVDQSGNESPRSAVASATPASSPGVGTVEEDSSYITYQGSSWQSSSAYQDSGGAVAYTTRSGSATFSFQGTAVAWVSRMSPSSGVNDVYLDGRLVARVDRYSSTPRYAQRVFERSGLEDKTHTLEVRWTGTRNPSATGSNLVVDSFVVVDVDPPSAPSGVDVIAERGGVRVSWSANTEDDLQGYRVYRSVRNSPASEVSGLISETSFLDVGVEYGALVKYYVVAFDRTGNESPQSPIRALYAPGEPLVPPVRAADCPAETVVVSNATELGSALAAAVPGTVIRLLDGSYPGSFSMMKSGTQSAPIWICGGRNAVIDGGSISTGQGLFLGAVSYVRVAGFSVTNSLKGLSVVGGNEVTVSDMSFSEIGYEALHVRRMATNVSFIGNLVRGSGRLDPAFGEGIYVGTSKENWCSETACMPDRVTGTLVALNDIADTGAQPIEVKEGTSEGLVYRNRVDGARGSSTAGAWILVKGNDWIVDSNTGTRADRQGFSVIGTDGVWGLRNIFTRNSATTDSSDGWAIWVHKPDFGTIVGCENTASGFASGLSNFGCQK